MSIEKGTLTGKRNYAKLSREEDTMKIDYRMSKARKARLATSSVAAGRTFGLLFADISRARCT